MSLPLNEVSILALVNVHSHLRDPDQVPALVKLAFQGGVSTILPMPNTTDPLTTADKVEAYHAILADSNSHGTHMSFIKTAYLTPHTTVEQILECARRGILHFKVYPYFRTTNSEYGIKDYYPIVGLIKKAQEVVRKELGLVLYIHLHPEHPIPTYDNRAAEYAFLPIAEMLLMNTGAIIIWEHGTDSECIPHWRQMAKTGNFCLTLTAHHLASDENDSFGDVRAICKPSLKRAVDRELLVTLVAEGHSWVMAGADDAPHPTSRKHVAKDRCACGAYTAPFLAALYAHALSDVLLNDELGRSRFIKFTSANARSRYDLRGASSRGIILRRQAFQIPAHYTVGDWTVEPFWAGREITWSLVSE